MKKSVWCLMLLTVTSVFAADLNAPAPRFTLKDSRQQPVSLADLKGKVVFVNFWAGWCAPCQTELPELNRLAEEFKSQKVKVLAINVDKDRASAQKLLKKLGLASPRFVVLWDSQSKVVEKYDIEGMPSSFILDAKGVVRYSHLGFQSDDPALWRTEIRSLLTKK